MHRATLIARRRAREPCRRRCAANYANLAYFELGKKQMIVAGQEDITQVVLQAFEKAPDPRQREILTALVRHLHGFAREVRLTEEEFHQACNFIVRMGQLTTDSHNEVVLMAGSLGLSPLIC